MDTATKPRPISAKLAVIFGLRYILGNVGHDPCDEWDIDTLLGLPEGLFYESGEVRFECERCGARTQWPADAEDFEPGNSNNLCGGSPRCCP